MSTLRFTVAMLLSLSACGGECAIDLYERAEACGLLPEADYLKLPLGVCDEETRAYADCLNGCYDDGGCDALDLDSERFDEASAELDACVAACQDDRG